MPRNEATNAALVFAPIEIAEGFRLNAMCVFLTYPQCDVPLPDLLEFLKTVVSHTPEYIVVSSEAHQDGTLHRHAMVKWSRRVDKKNAMRLFDFRGFHPNQQKTRNIDQAITYIKKDGDFLEFGDSTDMMWFFDLSTCFW